MGSKGSGRRPKPTNLRKAQGVPGHRPLNNLEPKVSVGEPAMPPLPDVAAGEWREIVPMLLQMGVLSPVDGKSLGAYCTAYALWLKAAESVSKDGVLVSGPYGQMVENPAVRILDKALKLMHKYLIEFGLTPASRTRLKVQPHQAADPFDEFLSGDQDDQETKPN